jgi:hypothetical protein
MARWQASWLLDDVPARREPSGSQVAVQLVLLAVAAGCLGLAVAGVFFTGFFVPATFFFGNPGPWTTESLLAVSAASLALLAMLRHHR